MTERDQDVAGADDETISDNTDDAAEAALLDKKISDLEHQISKTRADARYETIRESFAQPCKTLDLHEHVVDEAVLLAKAADVFPADLDELVTREGLTPAEWLQFMANERPYWHRGSGSPSAKSDYALLRPQQDSSSTLPDAFYRLKDLL